MKLQMRIAIPQVRARAKIVGPYQPVRQLRWHYRSQHESLIAFSSNEFYDDRLIVFPSPKGKDLEYGVHLVSVDGTYEAGLNRSEAETIIGATQEFMQQFTKRLVD